MTQFAMLHLSLLHARLVGTAMVLILIGCLLLQELLRPKVLALRVAIWVIMAAAGAVFVSTLLQVQHSIK